MGITRTRMTEFVTDQLRTVVLADRATVDAAATDYVSELLKVNPGFGGFLNAPGGDS